MNRAEVKTKLALVNAKIKELKFNREENPVVYATVGKYVPGIGHVNQIESIEELVLAQAEIVKQSSQENTIKAMDMLGVTQDELGDAPTAKIMGLPTRVWNKDLKNRLAELREEMLLEKLEKAALTLRKHLSSEDIFDMDTEGIDDLLTE